MTTLFSQQNIDKQRLSIQLRDLFGDVKVNLKHMIEDNITNEEQIKNEKKGKKKGKKVQPKKKDLIIQAQMKFVKRRILKMI